MTALERPEGQKRMVNHIKRLRDLGVIQHPPTSWEKETETTPDRGLNIQENLQSLVAPRELKGRAKNLWFLPTEGFLELFLS